MDTGLLSAILLLAGLGAFTAAFLIGPKGLYQEPDLQKRVQSIERDKSRWNIAQLLIGLSLLLTAAGYVALASLLSTIESAWIPGLGAIAFVAGAISGDLFVYRQTIDPLGSFEGNYSSMEMMYYWLALAGLLLFGAAFFLADYPAWLGWLTVGSTILYGAVFALVRSLRFLTPGLVSLLSLVIAIFLLVQ
jgi:hypothetical protein